MKIKLIGWVLILGISMDIQTLSACMPHSPDDVFISRIQSIKLDNKSIQFSKHKFIFRSFFTRLKSAKPNQWRSDFKLNKIKKNDLVIGLAYPPDGAKPQNYQISSIALLKCHNDVLSITKPLAPFLSWNRETKRCSYGSTNILNGFLYYDQAYFLQKLQAQYPTCNRLYSTFPID